MGDSRSFGLFDEIADIQVQRQSAWRYRAACRTEDASLVLDHFSYSKMEWADLYGDEPYETPDEQVAKSRCMGCPVLDECKNYWETMVPAMEQVRGVWFGTTPVERAEQKALNSP